MTSLAGADRGLRPLELATAAVLGAAVVAIVVLAGVVPHASPLQVLSSAPFGIVAYRHRLRALVASAAAASTVAFLLLGLGGAIAVLSMAAVGEMIGEIKRRGRGIGTVLILAGVLAPAAAACAVALLLALPAYRAVLLDSARSTAVGVFDSIAKVPFLRPVAQLGETIVAWLLDNWALTISVVVGALVVVTLIASWRLLGAVLDRLEWAMPADRLAPSSARNAAPSSAKAASTAAATTMGALPVELVQASVRYPGADHDALHAVDLKLGRGEFVAIVGDNGSGKSTLARLLAGASPTSGAVRRPGSAGLGAPGGTAIIQQRPDAQVLGSRVADDVVWGLPPNSDVDADSLLADVGLAGLGARETTTLSGGQLQRLAIAAALARQPSLLISDESTAMVDASGRVELLALLAQLPRTRQMSVVHVTHSREEADCADRVIALRGGRIVADGSPARSAPATCAAPPTTARERRDQAAPPVAPQPRPVEPLLQLTDVGHAYALGTPWEHTALQGIDLRIDAGEGVLIRGDNGSGKSTLAWIIAGLQRPSSGDCLLAGRPVDQQRGAVGLAFQNARLQLQRPTVAADILDAARRPAGETRGASRRPIVDQALSRVGLDPGLAVRGIDHLSGGQMRRVAIAGLLASAPRVVVLDEPLAGLDPSSRDSLMSHLAQLRRTLGLTLIIVSHDPLEAADVCSRTIRLDAGRIVEDTAREWPAGARA